MRRRRSLRIFGFKFFGSDDEEDAGHRRSAALHGDADASTAATRDSPRRSKRPRRWSQDAERPVSGSLGLLAKARADREQLVAALYAKARYDGVVDIAIDGKSLDDLPPDAEFGAGPVPVAITVDPGAVFTLGDIRLEGRCGRSCAGANSG